MNPFDDPSVPQQPNEPPSPESEPQNLDDLASRIVVHPAESSGPPPAPEAIWLHAPPLPVAPPHPLDAFLPEDLRITWSWLHLLFFALFLLVLLLAMPVGVTIFLLFRHAGNLTPQQFQQSIEALQARPEITVGLNMVLFLLVMIFLYVMLALIPRRPFWSTIGWKKFDRSAKAPAHPLVYLAGGFGLAIAVALVSSQVKVPEHLPLQELFKSRAGAFSLMAMAVLMAPLVEETVFRGFLYPLIAGSVARLAGRTNDPAKAIETGTAVSILLTGFLFGVMHGAQLGWTPSLVAMLTTVGVIFTLARARAGTVLASFLLHLGYNSMIAFSAIVSTHGFTRMPPHP